MSCEQIASACKLCWEGEKLESVHTSVCNDSTSMIYDVQTKPIVARNWEAYSTSSKTEVLSDGIERSNMTQFYLQGG